MDGRSEETERAGAAGDPAAQREQRLQRLINRLPSRLRSTAMWLRQPSRRWLRTCVGVLLIAGSLLSVLPVFGVWMLPFGVVLLAEDVPMLRRATGRILEWVDRRRPHLVAQRKPVTKQLSLTHRNLPDRLLVVRAAERLPGKSTRMRSLKSLRRIELWTG
jgi:hypothetical protein